MYANSQLLGRYKLPSGNHQSNKEAKGFYCNGLYQNFIVFSLICLLFFRFKQSCISLIKNRIEILGESVVQNPSIMSQFANSMLKMIETVKYKASLVVFN
jgi:hypothetical protein